VRLSFIEQKPDGPFIGRTGRYDRLETNMWMIKNRKRMASRGASSSEQENFDKSYLGTPPWDIGRAQKELVRLAENHEIVGRVLDIGCGSGENSIFLASVGNEVIGVDFSSNAIKLAHKKVAGKQFADKLKFQVADALKLTVSSVGGSLFDCIVDCGLFHAFEDQDRMTYVSTVRALLKPKDSYFMLCFSDQEPGTWGPRRVHKEEISRAFASGWKILYIKEALFENNDKRSSLPEGAKAWLSRIEKSN
jgi:ubiquinone/menaquinone biosynthesis C-methylase UbiE